MSGVHAEISPEKIIVGDTSMTTKMGPPEEDPYLLQPTGFDSSQGTEQLCRMTIVLFEKDDQQNPSMVDKEGIL